MSYGVQGGEHGQILLQACTVYYTILLLGTNPWKLGTISGTMLGKKVGISNIINGVKSNSSTPTCICLSVSFTFSNVPIRGIRKGDNKKNKDDHRP